MLTFLYHQFSIKISHVTDQTSLMLESMSDPWQATGRTNKQKKENRILAFDEMSESQRV